MQLALSKNAASLLSANIADWLHFFTDVAKVRQFANPRLLIKSAVFEFIGKLILDNAVGIV